MAAKYGNKCKKGCGSSGTMTTSVRPSLAYCSRHLSPYAGTERTGQHAAEAQQADEDQPELSYLILGQKYNMTQDFTT
jgi:hypothetical protein